MRRDELCRFRWMLACGFRAIDDEVPLFPSCGPCLELLEPLRLARLRLLHSSYPRELFGSPWRQSCLCVLDTSLAGSSP
jgi:hypothetical protein